MVKEAKPTSLPISERASMSHRTIRIDDEPQAVQRFFQQLGDQPVVIELAGKPVCVLYPSHELLYTPEGTLADAAGSWRLLPGSVKALGGEDT
jgi:hypothetical protein